MLCETCRVWCSVEIRKNVADQSAMLLADIEIQANEILHHKLTLNGYLAEFTGQSMETITQVRIYHQLLQYLQLHLKAFCLIFRSDMSSVCKYTEFDQGLGCLISPLLGLLGKSACNHLPTHALCRAQHI